MKKWLFIATILAIAGIIISTGALVLVQRDIDDGNERDITDLGDIEKEIEIRNITMEFEESITGGPEGTCHKYHWMMEPGAARVSVALKWRDTRQDLDISIGKGHCPDQGEVIEEDNDGRPGSGEGTVTLICEDPEILRVEPGEEQQWFVHIDADRLTVNCHYTVRATITYLVECKDCENCKE
jgi:hypothetical protein